MTPTEAKLKTICNWPKPQNINDVRSFLGFSNYYTQFIKNFTCTARPLMDLIRKGGSL